MSGGYTPQEAYDALPQLHLQAKKDSVLTNLRKHKRGLVSAYTGAHVHDRPRGDGRHVGGTH